MIKFHLTICIFLLAFSNLLSQKHAFIIYNAQAEVVTYEEMLDSLYNNDVILFGELHNNPISHWLQYEVTTDLNDSLQLVLGAEMIESDNQDELNYYLTDSINYDVFDSLARLWTNYKTDYAPLVDFAKDNNIPFVATNIPRRYANLVYKKGFSALDSLSDEEKKWIAPLPMPFDSLLPSYQNILKMMGEHGTPELVMAQATKDATMAYFILKNIIPSSVFLHYNGAYHSNHYEGILWYLKRERSDLKYTTISTVSQENVNELELEHHKLADFIICVDSNMTTTY